MKILIWPRNYSFSDSCANCFSLRDIALNTIRKSQELNLERVNYLRKFSVPSNEMDYRRPINLILHYPLVLENECS